MPWTKPLIIVWLAAVLVVAGLTLGHVAAWRSLCVTPATATGWIVLTNLDHGGMRYGFQVGKTMWGGTAPGRRRDGAPLDTGGSLEVFYAPLDPSVNQLERPAPGDWRELAVDYFLRRVFPVTFFAAVIYLHLRRRHERAIHD